MKDEFKRLDNDEDAFCKYAPKTTNKLKKT